MFLTSKKISALAIILACMVYASIALSLPKGAFWITDNGNRLIQIENLQKKGIHDFSIDYPAKDLDPDFQFFPYGGHHFQKIKDKIYSFYSPLYALFCLPFYTIFHWPALNMLSVLFGTATLLLFLLILKKMQLQGTWLFPVAILAFGTPIFFYSTIFWEHALTIFLAACGGYFIIAKQGQQISTQGLFTGGCFIGLLSLFREEGYVLIGTIIFTQFFFDKNKKNIVFPVLGFLAFTIPLWLFQQKFLSHFLGIHASVFFTIGETWSTRFSLNGIFDKVSDFGIYLFQTDGNFLINLLVALPLLLAVFVGLFLRHNRRYFLAIGIVIGLACVAGLFVLVNMLRQEDWVFNTVFTQGLFPTTPFLIIVLFFIRSDLSTSHRWVRICHVFIACYCTAACLLLNHRDMGVIWGPRFFLCLFPLLVVLSWKSAEYLVSLAPVKAKRYFIIGVITLFIESAALQSFGIVTLYTKAHASHEIVETLSKTASDNIVTDVFWLPEEAATLFFKKKFLMVNSTDQFNPLFALLNQHKVSSATFVFSPQFSVITQEMLNNFLARSPDHRILRFKHAPMLDCIIAPVTMGRNP